MAASAQPAHSPVQHFITRWSNATPSERANSQLFLAELCDLLNVSRPDPKHDSGYSFEHVVTEQHVDGTTSSGRIDLYKRACFVLESKQFQEAKAEQTQLELAAQQAGVIKKKKSSQPVRGTGAWDDAMTGRKLSCLHPKSKALNSFASAMTPYS